MKKTFLWDTRGENNDDNKPANQLAFFRIFKIPLLTQKS